MSGASSCGLPLSHHTNIYTSNKASCLRILGLPGAIYMHTTAGSRQWLGCSYWTTGVVWVGYAAAGYANKLHLNCTRVLASFISSVFRHSRAEQKVQKANHTSMIKPHSWFKTSQHERSAAVNA